MADDVLVQPASDAAQVAAVLRVELVWVGVNPQVLANAFFLDVGVGAPPFHRRALEVFGGHAKTAE